MCDSWLLPEFLNENCRNKATLIFSSRDLEWNNERCLGMWRQFIPVNSQIVAEQYNI